MLFAPLYLKRLGLDQANLDEDATTAKLFAVVEAHLDKIPFENLAQHGAVGGPAVLDMQATAEKILVRKRGGLSLELNGLLAELLIEWGYDVNRVPAKAYSYDTDSFESSATHMILIVTIPPSKKEQESSTWFVDVGSGEPALNPLFYEVGGMEQKTVGGIMSRFVHNKENVVLQWYNHGNDKAWSPRLCWNEKQADAEKNRLEIKDFAKALDTLQEESSIFSRKLVVCRLTRKVKVTLAGDRLKRTGPPRFSDNPPVVVTSLGTADKVRSVLEEEFGIPLAETEGLDLAKSLNAPSSLWKGEF